MLKLMQLEIKKHKLGWYARGAAIAVVIISFFMWLMPYTEDYGEAGFNDYVEALSAAGLIVRAVFIVFASVLISRFIIDEYKNKTVSVMFTYPVQRKKLIIAKMLLILSLTFVTMIISTFIVILVFLVVNSQFHFIEGKPDGALFLHTGIQLFIQTLCATGVSLIPIYFGMRKKSVASTIVSSVFIMLLLSGNAQGFSLSSNVAIPLILGAIGFVIAYLSFRNIDKTDMV
ncbi:ABC transporter permease subunit [Paenibacillus sp. HJL G12]|uniref:ABC transporter permease subunit n=1 Tax=Paenibacillus dendrobii TaxID=2691084 RepID=A0A7X3IIA7_9BACL|nr:ABC transporter permease [Paenibacillus dendrobii]MWV44459.1 ABC transporter permease subunit [Paenibacillus dendrobii]